MYGTDVITVVNKAIANNKSMDLKANVDEDNLYYVNIAIKLGTNNLYETEVYEVENSKSDATKKKILIKDFKITEYFKELYPQPSIAESTNITGNITLGETKRDGKIVMDNEFVDFFKNTDVSDQVLVDDTNNITYYIYSALSVFKKAVFTCSDVQYSDNGRIKEMTFTQVKEK